MNLSTPAQCQPAVVDAPAVVRLHRVARPGVVHDHLTLVPVHGSANLLEQPLKPPSIEFAPLAAQGLPDVIGADGDPRGGSRCVGLRSDLVRQDDSHRLGELRDDVVGIVGHPDGQAWRAVPVGRMDTVEAIVAGHRRDALDQQILIIRTVGQAFDGAQAVGRRAVPRVLHQLRMAVAPRAAVCRAVDDADIQIEQGEVHLDAPLPETVDESLELPVSPDLPVALAVVGLAAVGAVIGREHHLLVQSPMGVDEVGRGEQE